MIGVNGTTTIGFTDNDTGDYSNNTSFAGQALYGTSRADHYWFRLDAGYVKDILPRQEVNPDGSRNPDYSVSLAPFYAFFRYDGSSSAYYTVSNIPSTFNDTTISSRDDWFGLSVAGTANLPVNQDFTLNFGARIDLALHSGQGSFTQQQENDGIFTNSAQSYQVNNVCVGGGASSGASYDISDSLKFTTEALLDLVPCVTSFDGRSGPSDAIGAFSQKYLGRLTLTAGLTGTFN